MSQNNGVDVVDRPNHYTDHFPFECIDIIRATLTAEQFQGYCLGNELKYRLRAGFKGDASEDLAKAMKYYQFRTGSDSKEDNLP